MLPFSVVSAAPIGNYIHGNILLVHFVYRTYISSVANKDLRKHPGNITNMFTSIRGAIWGATPRSIEYSKPEARFRRV